MYRLPPPRPLPDPALHDQAWQDAEWYESPAPEDQSEAGWEVPSRRRWPVLRWGLLLTVWGGLALAALVVAAAWDLPRPDSALAAVRRPTLSLADRSGAVFASYGDVVGAPVRLSDLPPALPAAVVAVEDRRFWSHWGIDLPGIARAMIVNLKAGRVVQGGSTLTQQVAKNLFLTNARTWRRKVQEVLLTLWLERHFSKQEILEIWLNRVYLGSGAWGVDAAAQLYFGVPAARLALWQCAVLAGLPRAPSRFNPWADPEAATARTRQVLAAMAAAGALSADDANDAASRIQFDRRRQTKGAFADWAAQQAEGAIPDGTDAVVHTTLEAKLQAAAESRLAALLAGPGLVAGVNQGAVVAIEAATGEVRAMVGGRDHRASSYNRAVLARRQPGSAFKPFVWLAALEHGVGPDDTVLDAPISLGGWSPHNFDGKFRGPISVETGLAESINTVAVRLLEAAGGPSVVASVAHRLGIAGKLAENATLALGTSDVGVLELAAAYTPFFTGGLRTAPHAIERIEADGQTIRPAAGPAERVIEAEQAAAMLRMLGAVVSRGSGRAAAVPGRSVAGKTGTTQDFHDAWFVGGIEGLVIAIWLGNDDGRPTNGVTGGSLPAQLFHDIAREAVWQDAR